MDSQYTGKLAQLKQKLISDISYFKSRDVIYLDYPMHMNIGDHLIYQGAMEMLKTNGNRILEKLCVFNYNSKRIQELLGSSKNAILVCHGGGNFGDIYHEHQNLREKIVTDFPNNEVVILPQSVFFEDKSSIIKDLSFFSREGVSVHVRDRESFTLLKDNNVDVKLTPDCAHALHPIQPGTSYVSSGERKLVFRRRDVEKISSEEPFQDINTFDWDELISVTDKVLMKCLLRVSFSHSKFAIKLSAFIFDVFSKRLCYKAINYYSNFVEVDTDRLHGFLLAYLMTKNTVTLDNIYGKIERYKRCWDIT